MRRLHWILLIVLATVCAKPAVAAEKTVGVIMSGNIGFYQEVHKAFVRALAREGFDHRNVNTLLQMPSADPLSWTNAARKFTATEVDVLVIYGAPAALAAIKETRSIPIVYAGVYDPVAIGVSARNITGISSKVPITSLLRYLKKLSPFTKLAIVYNELEVDSVRQLKELQQLERQYGFETIKMGIRKPEDAKRLVFAGRADAVLISVSAVANEALDTIVRSAHGAGIPTVSQISGTAEKGVILTLAPSAQEQGEAAARLTVKMLRSESPAEAPLEVPRLVELVLNLREAAFLGIKVPADLLADATKVIK